jgi:EpsI family protein
MRMTHFPRLWIILALAVLVTLVYWPSPAVYYEQWLDFVNITYTHGWLVLAVCVALVLRSRREIAAVPVRFWPLALLALGGCILAWLVCYRASIEDLEVTIFPAIFWLAVTAAFGLRMGLLLAFPVAFFSLAVPFWSQLGNPLQELTVFALRGFFWLTGPRVLISGDTIHIPNGTFVIEEGCSGLHFMIVGLAVAALHGELRRDPWRVRIVQLALMAILALLANWVRVYTIIEAGYLTDMRNYLVSVSHYWFGWGVFAVALVLFFGLTTLFGPAAPPEPADDPSLQPIAPGPPAPLAGLAATVLVLVALPAVSWGLRALQPAPALSAALAPSARAPWSSAASDIRSSWQPLFPEADQEQRFAYTNTTGDIVEVFRVAYRTQRQGAELVGSGSTVIGRGLKVRSEEVINAATGAFRETEVVDRSGARSLIWSRYGIAGRDFVKPLAAQLWYGINAIVSNPPAALIAYRAACAAGGDCADARRVLREFVASGTI